MRELKVQCDCGQKFKFDVEPVNNQMPFTVACPVCNRDGTEKANMLLRAQAGVSAAPAGVPIPLSHAAPPPAPAPMPSYAASAPAPAPISAPAPAPVPVGLVPAPPPASAQPRLRLGAAAHAAPAPAAGEGAVPPPPPATPFRPGMTLPVASAPVKEKPLNIPMGVLGAVIGAMLGTVLWFFLTKWTLHEYAMAAWAVGVLSGIGARVFARGSDSLLGVIAASLTIVAILGGRFWFVSNLFSGVETMATTAVESAREEAYQEQMDLGKEALNAKTDDDFKAIYKKMNYEDPSDTELADFKANDVPKMKDIASGKITKEQFIADRKAKDEAAEARMPKFGFAERWAIFKMMLIADPIIFLFLALGAYSAYKLGAG